MHLTEEQETALRLWMTQKKVDGPCEACGGRDWQVGPLVGALSYQSGRGIDVTGPQVPTVQVICSNCALVRSFAALPVLRLPLRD